VKDISLHILDIAQNSVAAGATLVEIRISDNAALDSFTLEIKDNGRGIAPDLLGKVLDPFYTSRTTRAVGLGLSLLAQSARETGGDISVKSGEGKGTTVTACFRPSHIDMKPLGDIADTVLVLIAANPEIDFFLSFDKPPNNYVFDTRAIREELQDVPITSPPVLSWLKDELKRSLGAVIFAGGERRESGDPRSRR
jgi:hypothetical protein